MGDRSPVRRSDVAAVTVLVTGASGFLGRAVAAEVMAMGNQVRTFQRTASGVAGAIDSLGSITADEDVRAAVDGVDAVVHLAAKVSLAGDSREFDAVNVGGTRALLSEARRAGVTRFVHVSSPSVAHAGTSIFGDGARPADPATARGHYARTKAAAELLALAADAPGFSVVAVRPHLVWGPGDTQLIARIVDRARRGRLPLIGSGAALIDTTYVTNAASAIAAALDRSDEVHGRAFVVTNGEPRTVSDLLASICAAARIGAPDWSVPAPLARVAGSAVEALWRVRPSVDEPPMTRFLAEQLSTAHWFDQRATRDSLRWIPTVSLDDGFRSLGEWYGSRGLFDQSAE